MLEADPFEQAGGSGVSGQDGGLDAVEFHLLGPVAQDGGDCLGHQAVAPVAAGQVIADDGEVVVVVPPGVAACSDDLRAVVRLQAPPQRLVLPELAGGLGRERVALVDAGEGVSGVVLGGLAVAEDVEQPGAVGFGDLAQDQPGCSQHHWVAGHDHCHPDPPPSVITSGMPGRHRVSLVVMRVGHLFSGGAGRAIGSPVAAA